MQHVQSNTQAHPAHRLRADREGNGSAVPQQGAVELEPVRWHAVLPAWPGALPAGNRRRAEELRRQTGPPGHSGAGPLVALIRQWPSSVATVREGVLRVVRHRCRQGGGQEEISAQEQAGEPRLHRDRPVPVAV